MLATIAQLATYRFCRRFLTRELDPTGRQYDQMTQAARSGKVNIVEGSARAATSKETEMKLTDVARASLAELHSDYEDWLLLHGQVPWRKDSAEAQAVYNTRLDKPEYGNDSVHDSCVHLLEQQKKFARWLDSDDSMVVANALLVILSRAINMLIRQLEAQGNSSADLIHPACRVACHWSLVTSAFCGSLRPSGKHRDPATPQCTTQRLG